MEFARHHQILEVSFDFVDRFLCSLRQKSFDRLVMLGVAPGRDSIKIERFARNAVCELPDANGEVYGRHFIDNDLPDKLESMIADRFSGDANSVSTNAGSYLCNYAYFRALQRFSEKQIVFVHIPPFANVDAENQISTIERVLAISSSKTNDSIVCSSSKGQISNVPESLKSSRRIRQVP